MRKLSELMYKLVCYVKLVHMVMCGVLDVYDRRHSELKYKLICCFKLVVHMVGCGVLDVYARRYSELK